MSQIPCPRCGTAATAGKFCAACGTKVTEQPAQPQPQPQPQPPTQPQLQPQPQPQPEPVGRSRSWLPLGIVAAVTVGAAAVAAVLLLSLGGEPAETKAAPSAKPVSVDAVRLSAENLYVPIEGKGVNAVIPAGWIRRAATVKGIDGAVTATSAQDKGSSVTLGVVSGASGSLGAQARTLRAERSRLPGYAEESFRQLRLAGGRPAFKLVSTRDGRSTVDYVTRGCDQNLRVSGTAPEKAFRTLSARFGVVARSFQAVC
jgi:hypothetical protein